jgi:hypothetical protein
MARSSKHVLRQTKKLLRAGAYNTKQQQGLDFFSRRRNEAHRRPTVRALRSRNAAPRFDVVAQRRN